VSLPAITWLESPYRNLRDARYPIRGVVSHRIVGTLPSARAAFGVAPGTTRKASSHFGIGYVGGKLTIDQYVDLADMAWTNGDVRDPTWAFYQPGVNPNLTTVTIEHEDGGESNRGRVSDEVWATSIALQVLITSGDPKRIRAAGIRVRHDAIVAQLAAVPHDERGFIDHHQIAGPNKPYCFRRWLDDPGFVEGSPSRRDRLLSALRGGAEMGRPWRPRTETWTTGIGPDKGRFTVGTEEKWFTTATEITTCLEQFEVVNGVVTTPMDRLLMALYPDPINGPEVLVIPRSSLNSPRDGRSGLPSASTAEIERLQASLDTANKRTASIKTTAADFLRRGAAANRDTAAGLEAAAKNVESL